MRVTVEIRRPSWLTSVRLKRARPLLLVLALVFAGPVLASDRFGDVETGNPHHNDINAIANAGITRGCNPPTNNMYCPGNAVLRQEMASFLQRGLGRAARGSGSSSITASGFTLVPAATASITVPGAGFVLATGSIVASGGTGCPCIVANKLRHDAINATSDHYMYETLDNTSYASAYAATTSTWIFPVSAGDHSFSVVANRFNGSGTTNIWGQITLLWVPFGSTGTSTLGASDASDSEAPSGAGQR